MKKIFFTVGPSQIYPTVPAHLKTAVHENVLSMNHRGKGFAEIVEELSQNLKQFLSIPENYHIVFLTSATEAMERIIQNCVERESYHIIGGAFSKKFYQIAQELGKQPISFDVDVQKINPEIFDVPDSSELIAITQNETSNGWSLSPKIISNLKKQYPEKLIAVDVVSSAPYVSLDFQNTDIVFFSVQKGFGLPAGLGVLIMSPAAYEKSIALQKKGIFVGSYHSFPSLIQYREKGQTPETPNVLDIYLLQRVLEDMMSTGIQKIRSETDEKARLWYEFLSHSQNLKPYIQEKTSQSQTVIVAKGEFLPELVSVLSQNNFVIGRGYGSEKDTSIRIANFPAHSLQDTKKLIDSLKAFYNSKKHL